MADTLSNEEMIGKSFGHLTVLEKAKGPNATHTYFLCHCNLCGKDKIIEKYGLLHNQKDCGCVKLEEMKKQVGHKQGMLTIEDITEDGKFSCLCDCGNRVIYTQSQLKQKNSCGCYVREKKKVHIGDRYGKLTVIGSFKEDGKTLWHCRCDCGEEINMQGFKLLKGWVQSCNACLKVRLKERGEKIKKANGCVDGTSVKQVQGALHGVLPKNNKTGVRGVTIAQGRYVARIRFKGKLYNLGTFKTLEEASEARKQAEQEYFGKWLEEYEKGLKGE